MNPSNYQINDISIVSFKPEHLELADLRPRDKAFFERMKHAPNALKTLSDICIEAITVSHKGRIIACCGLIQLFNGVVELWLIPTIHIEEDPVSFCKSIKTFLDLISETLKVHRMQTFSFDGEPYSRFMEYLGFECEGTLKNYTDLKENYKLWARVSSNGC